MLFQGDRFWYEKPQIINPRAIQQKIIANKPTEEMKWNTENTQWI